MIQDFELVAQAELDELVRLERNRRLARRIVDAEERPPATLPEVLTLRERLQLPPQPLEWIVDGWLPAGGRAVMAAQAKTGKTTAALNLVRCLVDQQPWLGRDAVAPLQGRVAVIDFEMSAYQLDAWYRAAELVNDDRVTVMPMRGRATAFDLRSDETRATWAKLLRDQDVEFVVWDCLRPVMDALGLDEHRDAGTLLTAFDALLDEAEGPGALVVHHMGHGSERARGDSRIRDWPDVEWKLTRGGDDPASPRYISAYGRDVDQAEMGYSVDGVTKRMTLIGGNRKDAHAERVRGELTAFVQGAPQGVNKTTVEEWAEGARFSRSDARAALSFLANQGVLLREVGPRNAHVYRFNEASSPVRRSLPQSAGEVARQFAAVPIGRRAGGTGMSSPSGELAGPPAGALTEEQAALLEGIQKQHEAGTPTEGEDG